LDNAKALSARLIAEAGSDELARLERAYRLAFGRPPTATEATRDLAYLDTYERAVGRQRSPSSAARQDAWLSLCQTILSRSEFLMLD
jgi:hypothetical protein